MGSEYFFRDSPGQTWLNTKSTLTPLLLAAMCSIAMSGKIATPDASPIETLAYVTCHVERRAQLAPRHFLRLSISCNLPS